MCNVFFFNHFWSPYLNFLCFCKRHSVLILVFLSAGTDDDDDDDESEKEEKKWEEQQIQKAVKQVFSYNYYNGQTSFISLLVKVIVPSMEKKNVNKNVTTQKTLLIGVDCSVFNS